MIRLGPTTCHIDAKSANAIITNVLQKHAESITHSPELRKTIGGIYIKHTEPYVPYRTGHLQETAFASSDGRVTWPAPYAVYQYLTMYKHYTTHPGPYWDGELYANDWDGFLSEVAPVIVAAYRKNGKLRTGSGISSLLRKLYNDAKSHLGGKK